MASIVDICNGSLNQLGASTILTLTEDSKNARLCNARSNDKMSYQIMKQLPGAISK